MKKSLVLSSLMLLGASQSMHGMDRKKKTLLDRVTLSDVASVSVATGAMSLGLMMHAKKKRYNQLTKKDLRKAALHGAVAGTTLFGAVVIQKSARATRDGAYCVGRNVRDGAYYAGEQIVDGSYWTGRKARDSAYWTGRQLRDGSYCVGTGIYWTGYGICWTGYQPIRLIKYVATRNYYVGCEDDDGARHDFVNVKKVKKVIRDTVPKSADSGGSLLIGDSSGGGGQQEEEEEEQTVGDA